MSLIVYLPKNDEAGKRLQRRVGELTCQDSIEFFYTFQGLEQRLRSPSGNEDIALLLASNLQALEGLIANRYLFASRRIILIVPDRKKETISKGHLLRPRYLSCRDSDFSDVDLVLKKMCKTVLSIPHPSQQGEGLP